MLEQTFDFWYRGGIMEQVSLYSQYRSCEVNLNERLNELRSQLKTIDCRELALLNRRIETLRDELYELRRDSRYLHGYYGERDL